MFRIRQFHRQVDWSEIMRELPIIYGHKIQSISEKGKRVHIHFDIDGSKTTIPSRPLASIENLRKRLAFPADFSPRQFSASWRTEGGIVKCRLIVGLSAHHSGETSGVYLFGNGRMFARALRSRAVGYGESGNSVLRDHPSCWRIHAFGFIEADDGADIPWQAPLKNGVSENHPITTRFREMFRDAVSPYARFAKMAKASDLVPYTVEWDEMTEEQRAHLLFRNTSPAVMGAYRQLPEQIRKFVPPDEIETVKFDGIGGQELVKTLDNHARDLRQIISRRDNGGPLLEMDVLRAMNPNAFVDEPSQNLKHKRLPETHTEENVRVSLELESRMVRKLRKIFEGSSDVEAIRLALKFAVSQGRKQHRKKK